MFRIHVSDNFLRRNFKMRSLLAVSLISLALTSCSKEGKANASRATPPAPESGVISDDDLMKQYLAAHTRYVEALEKKASPASVKQLEEKSKELYMKFQALPSDRMGALMNKYMKEFDAVMDRASKARLNQQ